MSNNSHVLVGIKSIINPQNVKQNMDIDDIAKELMKGGLIVDTMTVSEGDPAEKFNAELAMVSRKLGIDLNDKGSAAPEAPPSALRRPAVTPIYTASPEAEEASSRSSSEESGDDCAEVPLASATASATYEPPPSTGGFREFTREQIRRKHIENVITSSVPDTPMDYSFAKVKEDQQKTNMLGEIDMLLEDLAEEGVDLSKIPAVGPDSSISMVQNVLRTLKYKEGRARGGDLAEQILMLLAKGAEKLCNGERELAGYRPNLKGWSHTVAPKIRRLRNPAGEIVHGVIENSGMGPLGQLLIEIVPSAVLYSATQSSQIGEAGIFRDSDMG
jgi:hypothetical protein